MHPVSAKKWILSLAALALIPLGAMAQGEDSGPRLPAPDEMGIFPYQLVDYTQAGHEYRIFNAQAVVLGEILELRTLENTEKVLNRVVRLRIESFLKKDRPQEQEGVSEILFRCLPLNPPLEDMQVGDRCLVLLARDRRFDNMQILPTDYHYYPVSQDGIVSKLFKEGPSADAPVSREVGLSDFLREVKGLLRRISIEEQARNADLVFHGTVDSGAQGESPEGQYYIVQIQPQKIYKGDPGEGVIKIHSINNMHEQVLETLNRPVFLKGQDVFIFANKDPTLSQKGPGNPEGETRWVPYNGKQSLWAVHPKTVWRFGTRPIKTDEFFQTIEELTTR